MIAVTSASGPSTHRFDWKVLVRMIRLPAATYAAATAATRSGWVRFQ